MLPEKGGEGAVAQCLGHLLRAKTVLFAIVSTTSGSSSQSLYGTAAGDALHRTLNQSAALKAAMN